MIFSSPNKSKIRILQSIGRTLRKGINKDNATLYDIADNLTYKARKNYTLTHLFERIKQYDNEKFPYSIHQVRLK